MSRGIAVEQRGHAAVMADAQGWHFETWKTTQELRMRIKYARKLQLFIIRLLYVQLLWGQHIYRLVWAIMINSRELPINDKAGNDAHIVSTDVRLY